MKKGFTLIELLAVIVILAIILVVAVPKIIKVIDSSKMNAYINNEKLVVKSTELYISKNIDKLPANVGSTTEVLLSDLITDGYIKDIKSPFDKNNSCNGYVLITKTSTDLYEYTPHINCVNNIVSAVNDGLVMHLKLNNSVLDYSLNSNVGTSYGVTSTQNRFGNQNSALSFGGVNSSVSFPDPTNFNFNSFTISMWAYYINYAYPRTFGAIKKSNPNCFIAGGKGWDFGHTYSTVGVDFCIANGTNAIRTTINFNAGTRPPDLLNKWTHIMYVVNRETNLVSVFINGTKQDHQINISSITGDISNTSELLIGMLYGWQTDGSIDDVEIYNRALLDEEIVQIYNIEKNRKR